MSGPICVQDALSLSCASTGSLTDPLATWPSLPLVSVACLTHQLPNLTLCLIFWILDQAYLLMHHSAPPSGCLTWFFRLTFWLPSTQILHTPDPGCSPQTLSDSQTWLPITWCNNISLSLQVIGENGECLHFCHFLFSSMRKRRLGGGPLLWLWHYISMVPQSR